MHAIREMPKPVIAAVNGPAVGIGCSLALCCDLILAAESAYFLLAFVNIGLVPDGGSSLFVPTRVGMARASELAMLGERLPARPGARVGADQPRGGRRRLPEEAPPWPRDWPPDPRAPTPAPSGRSTTGCIRAWPSSSSSRLGSSRRWPAARTSSRARWRSSRSAGALLGRLEGLVAKSSSASRPGLNRILAALGHLIPSLLAFFTPAVGRVAERERDRRSVQDHSRHRARSSSSRSRAASVHAGQVP